jgi:hypothetical protein
VSCKTYFFFFKSKNKNNIVIQVHARCLYKYRSCFRQKQVAYVVARVLRDSPESRKIPFVPSRGTIGTVPNFFRDGTNGIGTNSKKTNVPNFLNIYTKMSIPIYCLFSENNSMMLLFH